MPVLTLYMKESLCFYLRCDRVAHPRSLCRFLTDYRYHKSRKTFSKFYHRHSEIIVKYNIGLITFLQQGISEPIFYGDLVYKFKRIVGKSNFSGGMHIYCTPF